MQSIPIATGSSWFESGQSTRGSRNHSSSNTPASGAGGDVESDDGAPRKMPGMSRPSSVDCVLAECPFILRKCRDVAGGDDLMFV